MAQSANRDKVFSDVIFSRLSNRRKSEREELETPPDNIRMPRAVAG